MNRKKHQTWHVCKARFLQIALWNVLPDRYVYHDRTAYQVTQEAFKKHISQQQSKYPQWLNGEYNEYTKASDITTNNPMYWGLYYSSVGSDKYKNDLFENI